MTRGCVRARGGFTLVEVLAVVVLASTVAGALTVHVAGATDDARWRAAQARALEHDARARLLARRGAAVVLSTRDEGRALAAHDARTGAELLSVELGVGATAELAPPEREGGGAALTAAALGAPPGVVLVDRLGRSPDYELVLEWRGRRARHAVAGTTGWSRPLAAERDPEAPR